MDFFEYYSIISVIREIRVKKLPGADCILGQAVPISTPDSVGPT